MASLRRFVLRLVNVFRSGRVEPDLARELDAHLTLLSDELERRGLTPNEAHLAARRSFGGVEYTKDLHRDARSFGWVDDLLWDVRYALHMFRKNPGFTAVAVTMLAIGIGVNATVFTVTNAVLFKGSPSVDRNDRIVYIGTGGPCCASYPDFEDWRAQAKSFEGMGAVADLRITLSDNTGLAEPSGATQVSANTFRLIGQKPIIGRDFASSDEVPGAPSVAILSDAFWESRYIRDPAIIGQTIRINGVPTTVIGVMPKAFSFPQKQDLWVPLTPTPALQKREARGLWFAFGRMAESVTIESARAEMDTIGRRLATAYPRTNRGFLPVVMNFQQFYFGPNATAIYGTLWAAVGFVLLIACVNLANLLIARAMGRSREMSLRVALGARRWRIIRQLLTESVMLSAMGGIFGWWIATWGVRAYELAATAPTLYWADHLLDYSLDYRVFAYVVAMALGTGLLFGLAPAVRLSKFDINAALKNGGHGGVGGRPRYLTAFLVTGEMALAVVLLTGAGVMIRSFLNVYTADVGAKSDNVLTMFLALPDTTYPRAESQISFFDRLTTRLDTLPGVESAAIAWRPPTSGALRLSYDVGGVAVDEQRRPTLSALVVSSAYFRTLGATVLAGRDFNATDGPSGVPVAIVNQRFASTQWPGEDPLGKRLRFVEGTPGPWLTVVGVASNIVQNPTRQEFDPLVYVPFSQRATNSMWVFARTRVAPPGLGTAFRREVQALDSNLPIWIGPFTLSDRLSATYWDRGLYGALFLVFAGIGLLLASVGLYAVVAHSVSQRTQEIGIRTALGASAQDVFTLVFRQGMLPAGIGLVIGLAAAFAVTPILKSQLVRVSPADPITLLIASAVLIGSATLGCLFPARRAIRVDPVIALRHE